MLTITPIAEQKIKELMVEEKDIVGLRDVKVIMDSQSAPLLQGAEVDYVDSLQGSGFSIKNPQAKTTCGCGSSFSA
jgi:iron-sulfur cluster insertion protein